jgi:hypothetical protein
MSINTFSKRWDNNHGFTLREAQEKKYIVDESYGVGTPLSKWNPAEIIPDTSKKDGYMVVIRTK